MTDATQPEERIEFSDKDQHDLDTLLAESKPPEFHPILQIWREVLAPAEKLQHEKVTPQYATRMVSAYPGLTYDVIVDLQSMYYSKLMQLAGILEAEIGTDPDCLTYGSPEEDVEYNSAHYKRILIDWQKAFLVWEIEWDCTSYNAAVELAAISETHKMFFSQTGLTAFLDNIKFVYSEADQKVQAEALNALRDEMLAPE